MSMTNAIKGFVVVTEPFFFREDYIPFYEAKRLINYIFGGKHYERLNYNGN